MNDLDKLFHKIALEEYALAWLEGMALDSDYVKQKTYDRYEKISTQRKIVMSSCPNCKSRNTYVKDSRPSERLNTIITKRRRLCLECGKRYNTFELPEDLLKNFEFGVNSIEITEKAKELIGLFKKIENLVT